MKVFLVPIFLLLSFAVAQGVPPASKNSCPVTHPIKGNINSKGEKIYHLPKGQFYKRTDPERCFKTEQEAQQAGFRRSQR